MKHIKKLLLLLCLIVAGVQSAQADYVQNREWINKHADVENVPIGGVTYEVCHIYWKVGYVDQSLGAQYQDDPGYKERELTNSNSDQVLIALTTNYMFFNKPDDQYYASVVGITGSGEIVIPDSITNGGRKYPVKYIGRHTEQTLVEKDTTYYQQTWMSGSGYDKTTTCKYYGYTLTNVSITASNVSKLTVNGDVDFVGNFSLPSCSSVEFNKDVCFLANAFFNATDIKFNGATTISQSATLSCYNVEELRFNKITHNGKINFGNHGSLTDIYYLSNLPAYSGSANNYFEGVNLGNVTAHVANKTQSECDAIHSGWATYDSFGDVVPCTTSGVSSFFSNQTFVRIGGNGTVSLTTKHEGETTTYNIPANGVVTAPLYTFDSGDIMRIVVTTNGEETVEIFRDGIDVTSIFTKNGTTYTYEADDWEANELWFGFMVNVLDEAVWTIKYIDQRQIIYFKDTAVKAICVNKWDMNSDGELSMAEAAAVTYFFGTPPFANNGNITSFDELQYFTSLKSLSLAFKGCTALKSVVIPASVTDVTNAFEDCVSLESVTFVPGSTLTTIGEKAFKGCASLEATFALPEGVTSIGTSAFEGCSTLGKTLGMPNSLTQISASAFKDCTSLSLIYIPKNVTTLDNPFFTGCTNLDYIAVDPENSVFDSRNCCNAIIERNVGAYLQSYLRYACKNSTIPEGVHVIGSSAFAGLPITQIELPSTITLVGNDAFTNCQYLESVVCKATTPPTYQGNPFNGISQDCVLTVPSGCTEASKAAGWKTQDEDGVFKQIVEDGPELGPDLKVTLAIGGGCKYYIGMTYNGNFSERGGEGGEILSIQPFEKEKIGDNFYLKLIPHPGRYIAGVKANSVTLSKLESHGDTAIYDLSHLKTLTDSVVISAICKDRADYTKRIVRIKTKGVGENFGVCFVRDLTHSELVCQFEPSDLPLDRTDTLDVNTEYQIQFAGARDINLKRVTINGEEVEVTGNVTKVTPKRILKSFDENIIIEFEGADDLERYDVNRDKQISIADVTKLVNKILGKD